MYTFDSQIFDGKSLSFLNTKSANIMFSKPLFCQFHFSMLIFLSMFSLDKAPDVRLLD